LERVTGHVRKYAEQVPARIAARLADVLAELRDDPSFTEKLDGQLEAFRSAATRYAEPTWGAGQQAYGASLGVNDITLDWVTDPSVENCEDCIALEAGGPYSADDIPTWPKQGDTACLDRCYCVVQANQESWDAAFYGDDGE